VRFVVSTFGFEQESVHEPAVVLHPAAAPHAAAQHSFAGPVVQAVEVAAQEHGTQVPAPSQVLEHDAG
jgi:hypothetical protein